MKKFYAISAGVLMASAMFKNAQQLPNAGFEEEWGDFYIYGMFLRVKVAVGYSFIFDN